MVAEVLVETTGELTRTALDEPVATAGVELLAPALTGVLETVTKLTVVETGTVTVDTTVERAGQFVTPEAQLVIVVTLVEKTVDVDDMTTGELTRTELDDPVAMAELLARIELLAPALTAVLALELAAVLERVTKLTVVETGTVIVDTTVERAGQLVTLDAQLVMVMTLVEKIVDVERETTGELTRTELDEPVATAEVELLTRAELLATALAAVLEIVTELTVVETGTVTVDTTVERAGQFITPSAQLVIVVTRVEKIVDVESETTGELTLAELDEPVATAGVELETDTITLDEAVTAGRVELETDTMTVEKVLVRELVVMPVEVTVVPFCA